MATTTVTGLEAAANYLRDNSPQYVSYTSTLLRHVLDDNLSQPPPPPPPHPSNLMLGTLSIELFDIARNQCYNYLHNLGISDAIEQSIEDLAYYLKCTHQSCVLGSTYFSSGFGYQNLAIAVMHGLNFLFILDQGELQHEDVIKQIWDLFDLRAISKKVFLPPCQLELITEAMELRLRLFLDPRLPVEKRPWVFISLLTFHIHAIQSMLVKNWPLDGGVPSMDSKCSRDRYIDFFEILTPKKHTICELEDFYRKLVEDNTARRRDLSDSKCSK